VRYQRCRGLLAGQRATANMAVGSGETIRTEMRPSGSRPDDGWTLLPQAARSSPGRLLEMANLIVHPCSPRHVRVTIDAELNV
jgi:hypothetical protein